MDFLLRGHSALEKRFIIYISISTFSMRGSGERGLLDFFRLMPFMLIIIMGCSSEYPFWAMKLGSIPSTLKVFLASEGETIGVDAFDVLDPVEEVGEVAEEKRYFRFFWRKTGY